MQQRREHLSRWPRRRLVGLASVVALAIVAAALRFYCLGYRSLWLDEVATATTLMQPSLAAALTYAATWTDHTPLHFLLTWAMGPVGRDEFAVRLPYAVAGTLAALAMYELGLRLAGRLVAITGGVLMAVLPFAIFYSQESRPTILLMLVSVAMMSAAHAAAHRGMLRHWVLLAALAAVDLYTGYLAVTAVAVAYGYAGLVTLGRVGSAIRDGTSLRPSLAPLGRCVVSALGVGLAFLPWLDHVRAFLSRPDLGFGRVGSSAPLTVDAASALLAALDLHGILLLLTLAGIGTASWDVLHRRGRASLLPLLWFFLPLGFFAVRSGTGIVTIWPRYFAIDYPAALLMAALGVWGVARLVDWARRALATTLNPRIDDVALPRGLRAHFSARTSVHAAVCFALLGMVVLDALPADAAAYRRPKGSDYRGAVDRVLTVDRVRPVMLVVGENPDWVVSGLRYYAWARRSPLEVVDALKVDDASLQTLQTATSVWTAGWAGPTVPAADPPGPRREWYSDVWLLPASGSAVGRAETVLDWAQHFEPALGAARKLVAFTLGHRSLGPELLPPAADSSPEAGAPFLNRWTLQPGVQVDSNGSGFSLHPPGKDINAIYSTSSLAVGGDYLLRVTCDARGLTGALTLFVVLASPTGEVILPDGSGSGCPAGPTEVLTPFSVTQPSTTVTIWLRASGSGTGRFSQPSLHSLQ